MEHFDILIIGAGAAGISAAKGAYQAGCRSIAIADRKESLGGVLLQCSHRGFGAELSGPEYTAELTKDFPKDIVFFNNTTVLSLSADRTATLSGGRKLSFRQLILAAGCRETALGALPIVGTRPKGTYTAGQMQEMMNLHSYIPQGPVVIIGSGDIGLVMARQISELGIRTSIVEKEPVCGGMARNRRFLSDGLVELSCSCTVREIFGREHIEAVRLSDGRRLPCGTLLVAAGLIPEQELVFSLGNPHWLQLCGNCKTVHPMVEGVISEGIQAGISAWENMR